MVEKAIPKRALGKGFNSLLGLDGDEALDKTKIKSSDKLKPSESFKEVKYIEIEIARIVANPDQPRKVFDSKHIDALAKSLAVDGMIQPVIVSPTKKPKIYK